MNAPSSRAMVKVIRQAQPRSFPSPFSVRLRDACAEGVMTFMLAISRDGSAPRPVTLAPALWSGTAMHDRPYRGRGSASLVTRAPAIGLRKRARRGLPNTAPPRC